MSNDTLVSVHCYAGDAHQVEGALPWYLHHNCPLVVVSPENSKATVPGVDNIYAGNVGYIGQVSLDRQLAQMKLLLTYPVNYFLMHDSDSVSLDPFIPSYLYEEDVVWSNQVDDAINEHQATFPPGWPHVAFQPPYFMSRNIMEKLVAAGESGSPLVKATHMMPFIDFYMVQLTMVAGVPWKRMRDCISCPIAIDLRKQNPPEADLRTYSHGYQIAMEHVRNLGTSILHSVKNPVAIASLAEARKQFLKENPNWQPQPTSPPRIAKG